VLLEAKAPLPAARPRQPAALSPGMATLVRGGNGAPKAPPTVFPVSTADSSAAQGFLPAKRLLQAALFLADILLAGLAVRLVFRAAGPLGTIDTALCVGAVGLGAALSCLAVWLDRWVRG
jgi:hypothetical protein